jgi:protein-tyrosine phosphatase
MRGVAMNAGCYIVGRARQVTVDDFVQFEWILCMDQDNDDDLIAMCASPQQTMMLLVFVSQSSLREVPDPCSWGDCGFDQLVHLMGVAVQH